MEKKVYIFGAHSRGKSLKGYLNFLYPDVEIVSFLVDNLDENESMVEGIKVQNILDDICKEYPVYIATRGSNHRKIIAQLSTIGVKKIIPITVERDIELRNAYVSKVYKKNGREFTLIDDVEGKIDSQRNEEKTASIYVAYSIYDNPLKNQYKLTSDEKPIQVGAALTDKRINDEMITDDKGDNISYRNRQYCELTAMYWMWKHANEEYVGLAHYRRHFMLPNDWKRRVVANHIDVILPVPLYVGPSIEQNYKDRHIVSDWEYLMVYFKENLCDEYEEVRRVFAGNLYSPCNMFIMKKEILDELCSWLFPILEAVVRHGGEKEDAYMNRYPGFISERLITYFFEKNRERFNIVYANKNFLD